MNCSFSSAPLWSPGCPGPAAPSVGRFLRAALWSAARCRPRWWWACWWCSWLGWRIAECWASRRSSRRRGRSLRGQCKQNDVKHFCFAGRVWMSACGSAFAAHWRSWWSWSFRPDCLSAATSAPSLCRGRTPTSSSGWCSRRPATCQLDTHRKHISQQHTHTHTSMNASKPTVVLRLSPREEMTLPRVTSDLLMFPPSFSRTPVAPVASARSLPARSTRWILLTVSLGISASNLAWRRRRRRGRCHSLNI